MWGWDAISYWLPDPIGRYAMAHGSLEGAGAFRYSPVMALPVLAFHAIPWPVFIVAWTGVLIGAVVWLSGRWTLVVLCLPPVWEAIALGNVTILTTVCIVLGLRYPVAWLVPLSTKVTPGVGLLWFAVRGEWRRLVPVAGIALGLVVVSELALPGSWSAWIASLRAESGLAPWFAWPMMLSGVLLTVYAARTDRAWLLPLAVLLAARGIGWSSLVVLLATIRLWAREADPVPSRDAGVGEDHDRGDREARIGVGRDRRPELAAEAPLVGHVGR